MSEFFAPSAPIQQAGKFLGSSNDAVETAASAPVEKEPIATAEANGPILPRFWRNFAFAFFAIFALLVASGMANPLLSSPDEPAQLINGSGVIRGQAGEVAIDIPLYIAETPAGTCFVASPDQNASCQKLSDPADDTLVEAGTPYSTYNPLYYVITAWPQLIWNGEFALHAMRIMSSLAVALLIAAAFALARVTTRSAWLPIATLSTLSPMTVFLGGAYNPSSFEIATATLAWISFTAAFQAYRSGRSLALQRLTTTLAAVGLSLLIPTRLLSPVWALLILLLSIFLARISLREFWGFVTRKFNLAAIGVIVISTVYSLWWAVSHPAVSTSGAGTFEDGVDQTIRGALIDFGTFMWPSAFGSLGWLDTLVSWAPYVFTATWVALVTVALVHNRSARRRYTLLAVILLTILVPAAFEGFFWNGDGWQGRYTLPFALGIPLLAGYVLSRAKETSPGWRRALGIRWVPFVWGATNLLAFWVSYHRYAIGMNQAWNPIYFKWEPEVLGGVFWIVVEVIATVALVVWALRAYDKKGPLEETVDPVTVDPVTTDPVTVDPKPVNRESVAN